MIDTLEKAEAFAPILDRLSKLLPRLASDQSGEVIATVAAISRTLAGAKLDWHDLTTRLTAESLDDMIAGAARATSSPWPTSYSWPPKQPADPPKPQQPEREPSPWPTFGTTSFSCRKLWLKAIARDPEIMATVEAEVFEAFRHRMIEAPTTATTADTRLFNRLARAAWEKEIRTDRESSPWPTWSTLSHFSRLAVFDELKKENRFTAEQAEAFASFHDLYYRHQCGASRKNINLFNRGCRDLYERGFRWKHAA